MAWPTAALRSACRIASSRMTTRAIWKIGVQIRKGTPTKSLRRSWRRSTRCRRRSWNRLPHSRANRADIRSLLTSCAVGIPSPSRERGLSSDRARAAIFARKSMQVACMTAFRPGRCKDLSALPLWESTRAFGARGEGSAANTLAWKRSQKNLRHPGESRGPFSFAPSARADTGLRRYDAGWSLLLRPPSLSLPLKGGGESELRGRGKEICVGITGRALFTSLRRGEVALRPHPWRRAGWGGAMIDVRLIAGLSPELRVLRTPGQGKGDERSVNERHDRAGLVLPETFGFKGR